MYEREEEKHWRFLEKKKGETEVPNPPSDPVDFGMYAWICKSLRSPGQLVDVTNVESVMWSLHS